MIIGTAGHIDHGKTTLVRALTGVETDRLKEEKARGISIELGYAYSPLPNGDVLGIIDVPGHERFVHTMAAGAVGIDHALLVVAADDGVMPQTLEQIAERREDKMHFYHVRSQHLPIDAVIIAESAQQAISVALRHCYDWLPEETEKAFRSQLVANEVKIEAGKWPRWIAGREK